MSRLDDNRNKDYGYANANAKSKRRIRDDSNIDLADRIDSLQRAFAQERGEWERFRQEMRAKVRLLLERGSY